MNETTNFTPEQLMADPQHMLTWLRAKPARSIVTLNTLNNAACLAANFLGAYGLKFDICNRAQVPGWFIPVINDHLPTNTPITARRAIAAIAKAIKP